MGLGVGLGSVAVVLVAHLVRGRVGARVRVGVEAGHGAVVGEHHRRVQRTLLAPRVRVRVRAGVRASSHGLG